MKWVTLICLFIFTATESKSLNKRHHADDHHETIPEMEKLVGTDFMGHIVMVILAQRLQNCPVEEIDKYRDKIMTFAQHCIEHEEDEKCKHSMIEVFNDQVCSFDHLEEHYPWTKDCCAKKEPDRDQCFRKHEEEVVPYKMTDPEGSCKAFKENPAYALKYFSVQVARRHPALYPPSVLVFAKTYHEIASQCCEAEDKATCFAEQMPQIKKKADYADDVQHHKCHILHSFNERVMKALTMSRVSHKYPKASFEDASKLTLEFVHVTEDCCNHDVIECMTDKLKVTKEICAHKEKYSSKLDACCEKPLVEQAACIYALPQDDPPADLHDMSQFTHDEHVCDHFAKEKDGFLSKFIHEFARQHQSSSVQSVLRVAKGYEALLTKCCGHDNAAECIKEGPKLFEAALKKNKELSDQNCGALAQLKEYGYSIVLLDRYVKRMPEVSDNTLIYMTDSMTKIGTKCCALPEDKRQPCAEDKLDILLGKMCKKEKDHFINNGVRHCCQDSYPNRRPCFTELGSSATYKPPPFTKDSFHVGPEICDGTQEQQENMKKKLLIALLKHDLELKKEQLDSIITSFKQMLGKCCTEADHKACFDAEGPGLVEKIQEAIEHDHH
ncbi:albumin-like [Hyperolius riggenbachi]|uniref:albumin-like n=1 Tax=Hyperolius riggenbachi TaxID=752182 RepID=UPI0035A30727